MNHEVFILRPDRAGDTTGKSDKVPVTPEQIAESGIAAAKAGAASFIFVSGTGSGAPARDPNFTDRSWTVSVIRGECRHQPHRRMGRPGLGAPEKPLPLVEAQTDMASAEERLRHVELIRPEICSLDCGTMNFAEGDYIMANTTRC